MTARETADRLVAPTELERVSRAIAALDIVLMPVRFHRLFDYQPDWSNGRRLATMDNGSGDQYGGASELMEVVLDAGPAKYVSCTSDYLEREIASEEVAAFYELRPANAFSLRALNPSVDVKTAFAELSEMGYPIA